MQNEKRTIDRCTSEQEIALFHCMKCGEILKIKLDDSIPQCCKSDMYMAYRQPSFNNVSWKSNAKKLSDLYSLD